MSILDNIRALVKHKDESLKKEVRLAMALNRQLQNINDDLRDGVEYQVLVGNEHNTAIFDLEYIEYFQSGFTVVIKTDDRANKIDMEYVIDITKKEEMK